MLRNLRISLRGFSAPRIPPSLFPDESLLIYDATKINRQRKRFFFIIAATLGSSAVLYFSSAGHSDDTLSMLGMTSMVFSQFIMLFYALKIKRQVRLSAREDFFEEGQNGRPTRQLHFLPRYYLLHEARTHPRGF